MKKKKLGIVLVLLVLFAVGVIYAQQVCVISTVQITGFGTKTVTFTNNSTNPETVRVRVEWTNPDGFREWGQPVRAGTNRTDAYGRVTGFTPGVETWTAPGTITGIRECF